MCERVRLDIAYDGTDFSGWARQPELRTVQGVLEQALATIVQEPVQLTVAGRTDAGVHARGQVAHADLPMGLTRDPRLAYRLTRLASREGDVVVRRVSAVPDGFDARFSAIWRRYEYRLAIGELDPLERRTALHVPEPVDVEALQRASQTLLGLRDFAAFCKAREGATTIRDLRAFSWEPTAAGAYEALKAAGKDGSVVVTSVDGGCPGVENVKAGVIGATSMQYPLMMASLGVEAIVHFKKTGEKPQPTEGLDFFDTGVTLVTDNPVEGIDSITSEEALTKCWG